jgi:hypothetical protein
MSVFDSTNCDYIYLFNNGTASVPIYAGDENTINPKPGTTGIVIRFKTTTSTYLMGHLPREKCVKIKMTQDSLGFMEFISTAEFYKAFKKKTRGKSHAQSFDLQSATCCQVTGMLKLEQKNYFIITIILSQFMASC